MSETRFDRFWRNHPALQSPAVIEPCMTKGTSNHANQCLIRLGVSMTVSGVSLASYRGVSAGAGMGVRIRCAVASK